MPGKGSSSKEKYKTIKDVFDDFTEKNIFKLISQGTFEGIVSPLSMGKESVIFTARKGDEFCILKIYRLQTCDFGKMYSYLSTDPRYVSTPKKKREVVFAWAHREFRNLFIAREGGVRVPTPHTLLHNVLVMDFIGDDEGAAQKLTKAKPAKIKEFFDETVEQIRKLYKSGLVHGDLSGFNILNFNEKPVLIDFSQAIPVETGHAKEVLMRDVKNVCTLFQKWGIEADEEYAFKKIIS